MYSMQNGRFDGDNVTNERTNEGTNADCAACEEVTKVTTQRTPQRRNNDDERRTTNDERRTTNDERRSSKVERSKGRNDAKGNSATTIMRPRGGGWGTRRVSFQLQRLWMHSLGRQLRRLLGRRSMATTTEAPSIIIRKTMLV